MTSRAQLYQQFFPEAKKFRLSQIDEAVFKSGYGGWQDATNIPTKDREVLVKNVPWVSYLDATVQVSRLDESCKALLKFSSTGVAETVLMKNSKGSWTVCISSQIGCAMNCAFCATGKMGFWRNLSADEIIDQYRYWKYYLAGRGEISNIVLMGMGEPLNNYNEVTSALRKFLKYGGLAPSHITLSTVGVLPVMQKILTDENWPDVRIAVSLHSADPVTRKKIVPSSTDNFLPELKDWCAKYLAKFDSRSHYITLEYIMLSGINDSDSHAAALAKFANEIKKAKVNLIAYNFTDSGFQATQREKILKFQAFLKQKGISVTIRKSLGQDIQGACGQLANSVDAVKG